MKITRMSWLGVGTEDFVGTVGFFTSVLDLPVLASDDRGVAMLRLGDRDILEVFGSGTGGFDLNRPPVPAFEVEDFDAARDELIGKGVELIGDIGRWNGFQWQYFLGPEGRTFAIKTTPEPGWESRA